MSVITVCTHVVSYTFFRMVFFTFGMIISKAKRNCILKYNFTFPKDKKEIQEATG